MKLIPLLSVIILSAFAGMANSTELTKTLAKIKTSKPDTNLINLYWDAGDYYLKTNMDSALVFYNKANETAQTCVDNSNSSNKTVHTRFYGLCKIRLANLYSTFDKFDDAITEYNNAIKIFGENKNENDQALAYNGLSSVFFYRGLYDDATSYAIKALKIFEKNNRKLGQAACYNNLGNIATKQGFLQKAEDWYYKTFQIMQSRNDTMNMAGVLMNIAIVQGKQNKNKQAIDTYNKAIEYTEKINNPWLLANCYNDLASQYSYIENYDQCFKYLFKALEINRKCNFQLNAAVVYGNIAGNLQELNKNKESIAYADSCLKIAIETQSLNQQIQAYGVLFKAYRDLKQYDKAFTFLDKYSQISDSVYKIERIKAVKEIETKFGAEKQILAKNTEIILQKKNLERQKIIIAFAIAGLLLFLILSILIFRFYKSKKKNNIKLKEINDQLKVKNNEIIQINRTLEQQKEEIASQRDEILQKNEILTQQKEEIETQRDEIENHLVKVEEQRDLITHQKEELTDSINYAQRIQRAILPPEYFVKKCLPESFILYLPKDVVSGDFYYVEKAEQYVIFAAVDCTGHGVPGSMMSVIGYNLINQAVKLNHYTKPSDILEFLDAGVTETLRQTGGESGVNDGMDLALCTLNIETGELQFAGAYNGIVYVHNNQITEIKGDKLPIGVNYDGVSDTYTNHSIMLNKNDTVYLYSDGYADQFGGPKGKKFKYKPLKELLLSNANQPLELQKELLNQAFQNWKGNLEQVDDVMVIGVRF